MQPVASRSCLSDGRGTPRVSLAPFWAVQGGAQGEQGDIVVEHLPASADQGVAQFLQWGRGQACGLLGEVVKSGVDVLVAALDQPVGEEQQGAAGQKGCSWLYRETDASMPTGMPWRAGAR